MAEVYNKNATSVLDIYKPAKVLQLSVTSATGEKYWPHNDGEGDPWWSSSSAPKFYQYKLVMTVTEYSHGSHKTREHKKYNGLDIAVGDWIAGSQDGRCMQIISISSKSATSVTCIVEDVLRYNTFRSSTGSPIFSVPGTAILFTLNENGKPIIDPLPASVVSTDFYPNVTSRFEYFNPAENFRLEKTAHGFARGDVIVVTQSGTYEKANASTMSRTIGVVSVVGPGPNQFAVMPQNRIIDFNPALPGTAGSYIYADTDGDLTTTDTGKVVFLKIKDSLPSNVTSNDATITATAGDIIEINGHNVTLTGGNASTVVTDLNNSSSNTSVTANLLPEPGVVESDTGTYNYGLLGGYIPFSANITTGSGTFLANVTTSPSGNAQYGAGIANGTDIKDAIDALNIPNFSVSILGSGQLRLTESSGNAVTITNVTNDTQNTPFGGASSVTGLPLSSSATTGAFLHLTRADGGPIDIENTQGTPADDFSIYSAHNGQFPLGLYIEHGVRSGGITIVANITARDNLTSQGGDMAYVTDAGDGEWALYVYTGSAWSEVGNQDSAATDAQTITLNWTAPGSGFGGVETQDLANISRGARIIDIGVDVTTALSNWTNTAPTVEVGTASDLDQFLTGDESDLEATGDYTANPNYLYPSAQTNDLSLKARIYHRGATAGAFTITVTYV